MATIDGEVTIIGGTQTPPDLTARDAGDALKMSVGLIPVKMSLDMDKDGQVTSTDARLILQKVVGR